MTPTREEILRLVAILGDLYPDWRFGQLVVNAANWSANPPLPESIWDSEDENILSAIKEHIERRSDTKPGGNGTAASLENPAAFSR